MKKTILYTIAMMFIVTLGAAYAADYNGATDFSGHSYDTFDLGPVVAVNSIESSDAGGLREDEHVLFNNGATDFTGRSYDTIELSMVETGVVKSVERESAGGLRTDDQALLNGVTDFTGRSYDTVEIGR